MGLGAGAGERAPGGWAGVRHGTGTHGRHALQTACIIVWSRCARARARGRRAKHKFVPFVLGALFGKLFAPTNARNGRGA